MGLRWLVRRVAYSASLRAGVFRRKLPAGRWDERPLTGMLADPAVAAPAALHAHRERMLGRFFFHPDAMSAYRPYFAGWDAGARMAIDAADKLVAGTWTWFSGQEVEVGAEPVWNRNPFTGNEIPVDAHWSEIGDFGSGDIKVIWEPSRFASAYTLVRAYWRTGDERYAETFWSLVESWRRANPPQQGPNWKCGQETTFRVMAWTFGLHGFFRSPASTPERVAALVQMIAVSGGRIAANVDYALNQQNNHGVSEGTGLFTLGMLFPELRDAPAWRALGRKILEDVGRDLIYADGGFSQHSLNYQRLMLHDYLWSIRLGDIAGEPLSAELRARVGRSAELLWSLQDAASGAVPRYGASDGSLILPLSDGGYDDYRPVVQAIAVLTTGERVLPAGPWDEELLWCFGLSAFDRAPAVRTRTDLDAVESGYFVRRDSESHLFVRAVERFRHRPGNADLLAVDLTWRGVNVALDAGTCSYNDAAQPDASFDRTRFHNTVELDGADQMARASRFLWAPWPSGKAATVTEGQPHWEGMHDGYTRLGDPAIHRRAVIGLGQDVWVVADRIDARGPHDARLHWLLPDLPFATSGAQLELQTPVGIYHIGCWSDDPAVGIDVVRAGEELVGWRSTRYGTREPALALVMERTAAVRPRFVSVFSPRPFTLRGQQDGVDLVVGDEVVRLRFPMGAEAQVLHVDRLLSTN